MNYYRFLRYLYDRKLFIALTAFTLIASFSCGAYTIDIIGYNARFISLSLERILPLTVVFIGGLFFVGNLLAVFGTATFGFILGNVLAAQFKHSLGNGLAFLMLVGIPVGTVDLVVFTFASLTAFEYNFTRLMLRKLYFSNECLHQAFKKYVSKWLIIVGLELINVSLECGVFGSAYIRLFG